jgi:hypothetical protein
LFPREKNGISCSPWQLKFLLPGDIIVTHGTMNFPCGKAQIPWRNICSKFLGITIISYLFLYRFVTFHWKGLEENYNFVVQSISIKAHMQKL